MIRSESCRSNVINQMLIIEYIMNNDNVTTVGFQFEPVRETGTSSSYLDGILVEEMSVSKRQTPSPSV